MLSTLPEKKLHIVRWCIFLTWCLLIVSLFYDPLSAVLSDPQTSWSWLADRHVALSADPSECIKAQGQCIPLDPYPIGTRIFWGMVVPSAIFIVLVFGHEFWRRICPLYFFSQLPRALKIEPLFNIERNTWLKQNHFYLQFVLFYLGITARILFVNSSRATAGTFFILTLLFAAGMVILYGGRSWCHYVCPFGMVQTVFTGPRGLLASQAHTAKPYSITQSMCRTVDSAGNEQSACISCKSACMDIDAEESYWAQLYKPGRRLVQYGYLGLVIGYFCYYWLYAGNFAYYFSGVWSHEMLSVDTLLGPGFYIFQQAIAIPKLIAAPLTLAIFAAASCWICTGIERFYRGALKRRNPTATAEQSLHRMFSVCTFAAFNIFFIYGGRPEINNLPVFAQFGFQAMIAIVSSLWLYRTWGRSVEHYAQEGAAEKRRRQLRKRPVDVASFLKGKTLEQLDAKEVAVLFELLSAPLPSLSLPSQFSTSADIVPLPKTSLRNRRIVRKEAPKTQCTNSARTHIPPSS
ncbi:MAG: 4Fe-4S binding protein [Phormidesmis sp.]